MQKFIPNMKSNQMRHSTRIGSAILDLYEWVDYETLKN